MRNKKRYVVEMSMYVYADNDYMARYEIHKLADKINKEYPSTNTSVDNVVEQPFASFISRRLNNISVTSKNLNEEGY